ncbi:type II restriction endonuclease [uncultured Desulfovibrio sp.]|jgi:type II restriction enzyme|uniref:type II restriction endonuclease n=1 Tax=uncultured Desulfovibrio sp. TaxID=167968 RepID=UPI00266D4D3E|nr:type II restriction endonuclease [uncultured Desulfovibrio sp.]
MRNFAEWFKKFKSSIADYKYYTDFEKVYRNVDDIKVELNILNSLIGENDIELCFTNLVRRYPEIIKCIPLLLAVRTSEIYAIDDDGEFLYSFSKMNYSLEQYKIFMRKTGLFRLIQEHLVSNLVDYATGVETGLDSNGRKNRGGHLMENLVESHLRKAGLVRDATYFKEMTIAAIEKNWGINLATLSNQGKAVKRFDFVVKASSNIYGIETNFYASGGSKLNETARSYKTLALEAQHIPRFTFVWFTDGRGWQSARNNLEETFDIMQHIYSIADLENGVMGKIFI